MAPENEKPVPVIVTELTVTGWPPVELKVTVCVVGVFRFTLPKLMLVELMVNSGDEEIACRVKVVETEPALAVKVMVCVLDTEETVAENVAVVAPAATVTEAGTVTAELLLARFTVNPPVAAAAFSVTVQLSVPDPVMDELVQESPVSTGTPVPLRAMVVEAPAEELLVRVNWPVAAPAAVGSNCTVSIVELPELRVTGKLAPGIVKPAPDMVAELMVRAEPPEEVRVSTCVVGVFTPTLPKATLVELTVSDGLDVSA